ncbi:MAG: endonuclease domain-containing protein [Bacteroidales bacterium]|nr:endonuclease domain-containing protein [Bacteroidales bacterium]
MRNNQIININPLKERRRELRKNLTPAEAYLWAVLKNKKLEGRKFRRQQSIENYIVDFCCPLEKLIIELDGEVHNDIGQIEYDFRRDNRLRELGYTVLRFENKLVFEQLDNVLAEIKSKFTSPGLSQ